MQKIQGIFLALWAPVGLLSPHAMIGFGVLGLLPPFAKINIKLVCAICILPFLTIIYALEPHAAAITSLKFLSIIVLAGLIAYRDSKYLKFGLYLTLGVIILDWGLNNPLQGFFLKSNAKLYAQPALLIAMTVAGLYFKDIPIIILSIFSLSLVDCDTALLALLCGVLGHWVANRYLKTFFIIIWLLSFLAPVLVHYVFTEDNIKAFNYVIKDHSYIHRMHIYKNATDLIIQKPLLGYGANYSHSKKLWEKTFTFSYINERSQKITYNSPLIPHHPHNFALQLWLEFGFLGMCYFSILWYYCYHYLRENPQQMGLILGALVTTGLSISIWQSWWLMIFAILLALNQKKP